jgi:hypothetical protein
MGIIQRLIPVTEPIPEFVTEKRKREADLRKEVEEESKTTLAFKHGDPSLRRLSSHKAVKQHAA